MITRKEKLETYTSRIREFLDHRSMQIAEVTNQEVAETLGDDVFIEQNGAEAEDLIYNELIDDPENFYNFCGFNADEFGHLLGISGNIFIWKGRGRKPNVSSKDTLLLLLHYLRRYPKFDSLGQGTGFSVSTLERLFNRAIPAASEWFFQKFVTNYAVNGDLPTDPNVPGVGYIVDATVQRINAPSGTFEEKKQFYSGKHGFYCLKSQVITDMKGVALHVVTNIDGAVHDLEVFKESIQDIQFLMDHHPNTPKKILADKGYVSREYAELLTTPHKGQTITLSRSQLNENQRMGKVRVIIENFFGRMKNRYAIIGSTYRNDRDSYSAIFRLCVALTNFDIIYC